MLSSFHLFSLFLFGFFLGPFQPSGAALNKGDSGKTSANHPDLVATKHHGGLALTFDGYGVRQWAALAPLLKQHGAKVTFYVERINKIKSAQIKQLQSLMGEGHEIGCGQLSRADPNKLLKKHSVDYFLKKEVNPSMELLMMRGLNYQSYGFSKYTPNPVLIEALQTKFKTIRLEKVPVAGTPVQQMDAIFYGWKKTRILYGLSFLNRHRIPGEQLEKALDRAKLKGEVLILAGRNPTNNTGPDHISINRINWLLGQAKTRGLVFYRISDLLKNE